MSDRIFRLARLTERAKNDAGGFFALEDRIAEANAGVLHEGSKVWVSRHKLKQIAEADDTVVLKLFELRAIDRFLARHYPGEALADKPLFEKLALLESLGQCGQVCFILGSRQNPRLRVHDLRRWDCRAMGQLMHDLGAEQGRIQFDLEDVPQTTPIEVLGSDDWLQRLNAGKSSLVCIGAIYACLATEILLARMFKVPPFNRPQAPSPPRPFSFIASPDHSLKFASSFRLNWEEIAHRDRRLAREIEAGKASAMLFEDELYRVPRNYRQTKMYGLIAAQRQNEGQIYLVVAGMSRPATFGASQLVREIVQEIPYPTDTHSPNPVLWAPVEVEVTIDSHRRGDQREVTSARLLHAPRVWPPSTLR